jgi:hypothetical protein
LEKFLFLSKKKFLETPGVSVTAEVSEKLSHQLSEKFVFVVFGDYKELLPNL